MADDNPSIDTPVEILLVEDNPTDAELTIGALRETGMANHLVWVKDGAAAVDFVFHKGQYENRKNGSPHLIVLDLQLPKLNGIDVLRRLKADPVAKQIPVVVLTSSQMERDIRDCYALGVNSYVSKPVEFSAFAQAVAHLGMYWMLINRVPG